MRSFLIFDLSVAGFIFRSFAAPILSSNVAIRHFQSHHNTLGYKLGYQLIKPALNAIETRTCPENVFICCFSDVTKLSSVHECD